MTGQSRPDLRVSYLEHRSMRMDAARLVELVGAAQPTDAARLGRLAGWYAGYEGAIHDHHRAEDAVIYPALLARDPSFADAEGELDGEHRMLADRLAVARESLGGLAAASGRSRWERERDEAVQATRALQAIVDAHTGHEEAVAFPRYSATFTATEYEELGKAAWKLVGQRAIVFAGPWVLDHASAAEGAELLASQPRLLRLIYWLALRPRYERLVRPLRENPVRSHPEV